MFTPIPITSLDAAARLGVARVTIRTWGSRYKARKLGAVGKTVYYDLADLTTIDMLIRGDIPIPLDPEERDRIRLEMQLGGQAPPRRSARS